MSKITSDNRYYILPWNHDEIIELLKALDTRCLLTPEEYEILINEKGVENLVTELDTEDLLRRVEEVDSTKARKDDFDILISKLNQMIRISEDQEEGNLELIDIRNGANGKTYLTAGDAIRNQFKDLNNLVEPIMVSNVNQDEQIYKLKTDSAALLENYNLKIQEVDALFENNNAEIKQLKEQSALQNIKIMNLLSQNEKQQNYLNALLDDSDMAKAGKVEYIIYNQNKGVLHNTNPKGGEGTLIVDTIKGMTLTNLSTASSSFIIEEDQAYSQMIPLKADKEYIAKFKCITEDREKESVTFETVKLGSINEPLTFKANSDYSVLKFNVDEDGEYEFKLDCIEQVEIVDLVIVEYKSGLEDVEYFNGTYSTFEDFLNEETKKYELTIATSDPNGDELTESEIHINLSTPLLEYDEIVFYGGLGFCHIHRTELDEETRLPIRIEDETQVEIEQLEASNIDTDRSLNPININELFIAEDCNFMIYKRGSYITPSNAPDFSAVPPESVITYYDTTLYNAAAIAANIEEVEDQNYEVMAINWDMNYRMAEIQWALEENGINQIEGDGFVEPMNFSVVEIAKKLINAHKYVENIFIKQLDRYLLKGVISKKEYRELIDMMKK